LSKPEASDTKVITCLLEYHR